MNEKEMNKPIDMYIHIYIYETYHQLMIDLQVYSRLHETADLRIRFKRRHAGELSLVRGPRSWSDIDVIRRIRRQIYPLMFRVTNFVHYGKSLMYITCTCAHVGPSIAGPQYRPGVPISFHFISINIRGC